MNYVNPELPPELYLKISAAAQVPPEYLIQRAPAEPPPQQIPFPGGYVTPKDSPTKPVVRSMVPSCLPSVGHSGGRYMVGVTTAYLKSAFTPDRLLAACKRLHKALEHMRAEWDTVAFAGTSGSAVAFALSALYGYPITLVRKSGEQTHHFSSYNTKYCVEGLVGPGLRYMIVDEMVSSGATVDRINAQFKIEFPSMQCAGLLLYEHWKTEADKHYYRHERLTGTWDFPIINCAEDFEDTNG